MLWRIPAAKILSPEGSGTCYPCFSGSRNSKPRTATMTYSNNQLNYQKICIWSTSCDIVNARPDHAQLTGKVLSRGVFGSLSLKADGQKCDENNRGWEHPLSGVCRGGDEVGGSGVSSEGCESHCQCLPNWGGVAPGFLAV